MNFCKVVAILNITDYGLINAAIQQHNVPGVTVSMVKGFGDYVNEFHPFGFSENMKVEIYTEEKQAEQLAESLSELANRLTDGGGIVVIEPVAMLYNMHKFDNQAT